ncbi:hypothetical protein [Xanthobacter sp. VNH20]|jgi:2,4-dienoyl-CoA reductase-like NADH-dependent reductase (Old Yellow Enzyme family)|uniref:oxidoreductase n=1 Tax=Xanthobacteraceae TaxID=335928 RepID=UPI0032B60AFC
MADLFSDLAVKDVRLRNRIAVSPMCQYSAEDGLANDWHMVTLGARAAGGAGLVMVEAPRCRRKAASRPGTSGSGTMRRPSAFPPSWISSPARGAVPGIQIGHAGRKASANRPWEGDDHMDPADPRAWQPIAPSALAFGANLPRVPKVLISTES